MNDDRITLVKFPVANGEGYRAGDTVYLYTKKPLVRPGEVVKRALDIMQPNVVHDQTASLREWATKNGLPSPRDESNLYNYVLTINDAELPTVWPSRKFMRAHRTLSPKTMESYVPTIVYPMGNSLMCRFGHPKKHSVSAKRGNVNHCYKCAWWRSQGIDLSVYTPTHCLKGHSLHNNRWLSGRRNYVTEHCIQCNNEEIMNKYGYKPND